MINTTINDIIDIDDKGLIEVELSIWSTFTDQIVKTYNIRLDLNKMGIDKDSDYEFQLSKDLDRYVVKYDRKHHELPTVEDIKNEFENRNYISIETRKKNG